MRLSIFQESIIFCCLTKERLTCPFRSNLQINIYVSPSKILEKTGYFTLEFHIMFKDRFGICCVSVCKSLIKIVSIKV